MNNENNNPNESATPVNATTISCPRCQGTMVQGWIFDSAHGGVIVPQTWLRGTSPLPRSWAGQVMPPEEDRKQVYTYRCSLCGYLESYAR